MLYEPLVTWRVRHLEGCVVTHRSIREQLGANPSIPPRQPTLPCDSHGLRLRPSNAPDLTWPTEDKTVKTAAGKHDASRRPQTTQDENHIALRCGTEIGEAEDP